MIRQCFLTGLTSEETLIHQLILVNPLTNTQEEVFVGDLAYKVVCASNDYEVARLWAAYNEAESSGYTDSGFISMVTNWMRRHDYQLKKSNSEFGTVLVAVNQMPVMSSANRFIAWRTPKPVFRRRLKLMVHNSSYIPWLDLSMAPWHDDATVVDEKGVPLTYDVSERLVHFAVTVSHESNPFQTMIHESTLPGFELMRRTVL